MAFKLTFAFPASVLGPVDSCALARLAFNLASDADDKVGSSKEIGPLRTAIAGQCA
jgi:hypothetical protein